MSESRRATTPEELEIVLANITKLSADKKALVEAFFKKEMTEENVPATVKTLIEIGFFIRITPSTSLLAEAYKSLGLNVVVPTGGSWHSQTMMACHYKGVQYTVDDHGHFHDRHDSELMKSNILCIQFLMENYHSRIKKIYDHLMSLNIGDIWVMAAPCGSSYLHCIIGNSTGYLARLDEYVNDDDEDDIPMIISNPIFGSEKLVLDVQFERNNIYFENVEFENIEIDFSEDYKYLQEG